MDISQRNLVVSAGALALIAGLWLGALPSANTAPLGPGHVHDSGGEAIVGFCGDLTVRYDLAAATMAPADRDRPFGLVHAHPKSVFQSYSGLTRGMTLFSKGRVLLEGQRVTQDGDGTWTVALSGDRPLRWIGPDGVYRFHILQCTPCHSAGQ